MLSKELYFQKAEAVPRGCLCAFYDFESKPLLLLQACETPRERNACILLDTKGESLKQVNLDLAALHSVTSI